MSNGVAGVGHDAISPFPWRRERIPLTPPRREPPWMPRNAIDFGGELLSVIGDVGLVSRHGDENPLLPFTFPISCTGAKVEVGRKRV